MDGEFAIWAAVLAVVDIALACGVTIHAVLRKRDTRAVIAWVGLAWLAPVIGVLAYVCLGINRIERKASALKLDASWGAHQQPELSADDLAHVELFAREYPHLVGLSTAGAWLSGRHVVPGNKVEPLIDGDQAYPAMLQAIADARRSVALLSYIFDSDRAGDAFLEALLNAEQRNVRARVLIDDVGSKYSRPNMVGRLRDAGLTAASFLPTRLPRLPRYANLRNHRKILVVDGSIGFTGGTNIREGHWLSMRPEYPVQCLNFEFNMECYDGNLAQSLNAIVDKKAQSARRITLDDVNGRSFPVRLRDGLARLLTPYL